ncbi:unnamed protein product [Linum tenue]|uniref:Uncharacterized protein n=1 Tax=Linum tenue TaxID=586396 RepID=A0AAV0QZQ8_9ROSI|nr:unnamed protein product [Linum tenue]
MGSVEVLVPHKEAPFKTESPSLNLQVGDGNCEKEASKEGGGSVGKSYPPIIGGHTLSLDQDEGDCGDFSGFLLIRLTTSYFNEPAMFALPTRCAMFLAAAHTRKKLSAAVEDLSLHTTAVETLLQDVLDQLKVLAAQQTEVMGRSGAKEKGVLEMSGEEESGRRRAPPRRPRWRGRIGASGVLSRAAAAMNAGVAAANGATVVSQGVLMGGTFLAKLARLEFGKFSGDDPGVWFPRVEQFFEFQEMQTSRLQLTLTTSAQSEPVQFDSFPVHKLAKRPNSFIRLYQAGTTIEGGEWLAKQRCRGEVGELIDFRIY